MPQVIAKYIHKYFNRLVEEYGFVVSGLNQRPPTYYIQFSSSILVIELEQYHREVYAYVGKRNEFSESTMESVFNLVEYIHRDVNDANPFNGYHEERNIEIQMDKQLQNIASLIYVNFDNICEYFDDLSYGNNVVEFRKFWRNKYP